MLKYIFTIASAALVLGSCAVSKRTSGTDQDLKTLVSYMTGAFNSAEQAKRDSDFYNISLHMAPVRTAISNDQAGYWLYIEQAVTANIGKPYRQRLYLVQRTDQNTFKSRVFLLKKEKEFVGAWKNPAQFDQITPDDIEEKEGCAVVLNKQPDGSFTGGTQGSGCESNLRGASWASSKVTITANALLSWDQGFDASGKQVWGATKGGYEFIKQK